MGYLNDQKFQSDDVELRSHISPIRGQYEPAYRKWHKHHNFWRKCDGKISFNMLVF